jgi:hypothetical protein
MHRAVTELFLQGSPPAPPTPHTVGTSFDPEGYCTPHCGLRMCRFRFAPCPGRMPSMQRLWGPTGALPRVGHSGCTCACVSPRQTVSLQPPGGSAPHGEPGLLQAVVRQRAGLRNQPLPNHLQASSQVRRGLTRPPPQSYAVVCTAHIMRQTCDTWKACLLYTEGGWGARLFMQSGIFLPNIAQRCGCYTTMQVGYAPRR